MDEEARLNRIIQNVGELKRGMEEEKIRCVMELEREEEGIVNGLMGRLEDVRREKRMLEERVYNSGGSGVGGGGDDELEVLMNLMDRQETELGKQHQEMQQQRDVASLVGPFGRLGVEAQAQDTTTSTQDREDDDLQGATRYLAAVEEEEKDDVVQVLSSQERSFINDNQPKKSSDVQLKL